MRLLRRIRRLLFGQIVDVVLTDRTWTRFKGVRKTVQVEEVLFYPNRGLVWFTHFRGLFRLKGVIRTEQIAAITPMEEEP